MARVFSRNHEGRVQGEQVFLEGDVLPAARSTLCHVDGTIGAKGPILLFVVVLIPAPLVHSAPPKLVLVGVTHGQPLVILPVEFGVCHRVAGFAVLMKKRPAAQSIGSPGTGCARYYGFFVATSTFLRGSPLLHVVAALDVRDRDVHQPDLISLRDQILGTGGALRGKVQGVVVLEIGRAVGHCVAWEGSADVDVEDAESELRLSGCTQLREGKVGDGANLEGLWVLARNIQPAPELRQAFVVGEGVGCDELDGG